ncbi:MAG: AraC family ligand binding domain-containing protein [Pseudohongiellaceae bacterium]
MAKPLLTSLALLVYSTLTTAQTPLPPALYVDAEDIATALAQAASERPAMAVSTITTTEQYRINLIRRTEAAGAIIHEVGTELHYITEGAGTLVTGGTVVRPTDGGRPTIEGGLARQVTAGDAILIPEGTPHWYSAVDGSVTYLEVRFNVPVPAQ